MITKYDADGFQKSIQGSWRKLKFIKFIIYMYMYVYKFYSQIKIILGANNKVSTKQECYDHSAVKLCLTSLHIFVCDVLEPIECKYKE